MTEKRKIIKAASNKPAVQPYVVPSKWAGLPTQIIEKLQEFKVYIDSGLLPAKVDTPEKAFVIAVAGKELGLPAIVSFKHLYVIDGTPAVDGIVLMALLQRNNVSWKTIEDFVEDNDNTGMIQGFRNRRTTIEFYHKDMVERGSFTKKRAVQTKVSEKKGTKLIDKFNYQNWLPEMLWWRAFSIGARRIAGGLTAGVLFADEVDTLYVDPGGNVLDEDDIKRLSGRGDKIPLKESSMKPFNLDQPGFTEAPPSEQEKIAKKLLITKTAQHGENERTGQEEGGSQKEG